MTLTLEAGAEVAKAKPFVCGFCGSAPATRDPDANHHACRSSECLCAQVHHVPDARVREYQAKYLQTTIKVCVKADPGLGLEVGKIPKRQKRPYKQLTPQQKENRRKNLVKARKVAAKKRAKSRGS